MKFCRTWICSECGRCGYIISEKTDTQTIRSLIEKSHKKISPGCPAPRSTFDCSLHIIRVINENESA